jgi:hypothetical protein
VTVPAVVSVFLDRFLGCMIVQSAATMRRVHKELRELQHNLPCTPSSSIFVRYDKARPQFMKVCSGYLNMAQERIAVALRWLPRRCSSLAPKTRHMTVERSCLTCAFRTVTPRRRPKSSFGTLPNTIVYRSASSYRKTLYCFCDRSVREKAWRSRKRVAQAT